MLLASLLFYSALDINLPVNPNNRGQCNPQKLFCTSKTLVLQGNFASPPFQQPRKLAVYAPSSQCLFSPLFHGGSLVKFNIKINKVAECSALISLCQSTAHQLKSFAHSRINLSPFTKDFRVRGTQIEPYNYFSELPTWKH